VGDSTLEFTSVNGTGQFLVYLVIINTSSLWTRGLVVLMLKKKGREKIRRFLVTRLHLVGLLSNVDLDIGAAVLRLVGNSFHKLRYIYLHLASGTSSFLLRVEQCLDKFQWCK